MKNYVMPITELSYWEAKPFWCQPWSIVLTGLLLIGFSTWWPKILWITIVIAIFILLWWFLFLIVAPIAYYEQKNVEIESE